MGIGGINGFSPSYPIEPIKQVDLDTVRQQDALKQQQENEIPSQTSLEVQSASDSRSKTADLENISLNFNTGNTYDYIGKDSDVKLLDVDQVISNMKKDSVLDQYRYFVGDNTSNQNLQNGLDADGIVVRK